MFPVTHFLNTRGPLMPKTVLLDEWHVTFRIPENLHGAEVRAARRVLNTKAFAAAVRRAVLAVMKERLALETVRVALTG